ncbi:uncharacterized protein LOC130898514 [Diorhabda carinulata]|uniref:uncharacterized protein LOC130898514 n=1 Tax=Diorhabda carinulata TaxID=1163345 RepID=UPI0025A0BA9F|nr:uncharacterized protein LOC130898514 [Diorhabda carinulata]
MSVISLATYIYKTYGPNSKLRNGREQHKIYKKQHTTIGAACSTKPSESHNYLKKHTGKPCYGARIMTNNEPMQVRQKMPKIEQPKMLEGPKVEKPPKPTKNYIMENIKTVSQMKPKVSAVGRNRYDSGKPLKTNVDSKQVKSSPKSSSNSKKFVVIKARRNARKILISRLNRSFEELEEIYQNLPLITDDTSPIIRRKKKIEADLVVLENDIDQFLRGKSTDTPTHSKPIEKKNKTK